MIKHGDFSSPGFPVLETQHSITREIIDISEAPLDQSLFVVPPGLSQGGRIAGHAVAVTSRTGCAMANGMGRFAARCQILVLVTGSQRQANRVVFPSSLSSPAIACKVNVTPLLLNRASVQPTGFPSAKL